MNKLANMKKIFIISEYVNPQENSTGYYWFSIVCELSKRFDSLNLICPEKNKYRSVAEIGGKNNIEIFNDYPNVYLYTVKFSSFNNNMTNRLYKQIILTFYFTSTILRFVRSGDTLVCGTNPALLILVLPFIKKLIKFKWILLVHDVFPENLVPAKIFHNKNILYFLAKKYFDFSYASANRAIVIGRDMKDLVDKKINCNDRTVFIPNWVNPDDVFPLSKNESFFIGKLGWENKIVFQFFGNIGRLQGIDNLLEAISKVAHENAAFLFVGDGVMVPRIKKFIDENPSISIVHFGAVSLKDKNKVLSACDVALVTLEAGMLGLGVPSKSYFSLAADKPLLVVAESESEVARMVSENNVGWWCKPDEPDTLASLIDSICSLDLKDFHGRQRTLIIDKYSEKIALNNLSKCISDEIIP